MLTQLLSSFNPSHLTFSFISADSWDVTHTVMDQLNIDTCYTRWPPRTRIINTVTSPDLRNFKSRKFRLTQCLNKKNEENEVIFLQSGTNFPYVNESAKRRMRLKNTAGR